MDSTISSDPFAADVSSLFPAARWTRAGATVDEVAKLSASFSALSAPGQQAERSMINGTSDNELAQALGTQRASEAFTGFAANRPVATPVAAPTITDPGFGPGLGHTPVAELVGAGDDGEADETPAAAEPEPVSIPVTLDEPMPEPEPTGTDGNLIPTPSEPTAEQVSISPGLPNPANTPLIGQ